MSPPGRQLPHTVQQGDVCYPRIDSHYIESWRSNQPRECLQLAVSRYTLLQNTECSLDFRRPQYCAPKVVPAPTPMHCVVFACCEEEGPFFSWLHQQSFHKSIWL